VELAIGTVRANQAVGEGLFVMSLDCHAIARNARAGQFVHVRCGPIGSSDPLLRRPISLLRVAGERIDLYYDVVGRGTRYLAGLGPGDSVDLLGPLGRPFALSRATRNLLLVGGGIGLAPLAMLADEVLSRGIAVTLVAGFRTAARVLAPEWLDPRIEYEVVTDDGSLGRPGRVTDAVPAYLPWADEVAACGPAPMLTALGRLMQDSAKPAQVSLEERMGCGMGVCLSCVVRTDAGVKRVCRDGPVFPLRALREVQWRQN